MGLWKAQVTERNTFLEVTFDDDDGMLGKTSLRRYGSEPYLNKAQKPIDGVSNSRIMLDEISEYGPSKVSTDMKDNGPELEYTIRSLDRSSAESEDPRSPLKSLRLENLPGKNGFPFHGLEIDDDVFTQTHDTQNPIEGVSNSRIMIDEISRYGRSKASTDIKDNGPERLELKYTIGSRDKSYDPRSPLKSLRLENAPGKNGIPSHGVEIDDDVPTQTHNTQNLGSGTLISKRSRGRPCKGQRIRYQKTLTRLKMEIETCPDFNVEHADLPPSFLNDDSRKAKLLSALQPFQERVRRESEIDALLKPLIQKQYQRVYSIAPTA